MSTLTWKALLPAEMLVLSSETSVVGDELARMDDGTAVTYALQSGISSQGHFKSAQTFDTPVELYSTELKMWQKSTMIASLCKFDKFFIAGINMLIRGLNTHIECGSVGTIPVDRIIGTELREVLLVRTSMAISPK